ncbi:MAG: WD40 repeat domain-containing protein, partial [Leadbetterella sp.]|nr:WD40 repeat domain-containing protein [Leadbetterella sp.]
LLQLRDNDDKLGSITLSQNVLNFFASHGTDEEQLPDFGPINKGAEYRGQFYFYPKNFDENIARERTKRFEAEEARQVAEDALEEVERQKQKIGQIASRAYAHELAFKSRTVLVEGDRTIAFKLSELAQKYVEPNNIEVLKSILKAFYCNESPIHQPLPWASNLCGHKNFLSSISYSPNGKELATGSYDYTAKIWDVSKGTEILTIPGHTGYISCISFSPDGKQLITGSWDQTAKLWNLSTGKEIFSFTGHSGKVSSVAISPNGQMLATGSSDNSVKLWNINTGKEILTIDAAGEVLDVAFSPTGDRLAFCNFISGLNIWELSSRKNLIEISIESGYILSLAFSPNGQRIAATSEKTVYVWDIDNGSELLKFVGHTSLIYRVVFSPDSKNIATCSVDKTAKIWDSITGTESLKCIGHTGEV